MKVYCFLYRTKVMLTLALNATNASRKFNDEIGEIVCSPDLVFHPKSIKFDFVL